ncbi:hypothetical protein [Hymenobacter rubidus]|uniref:hypothetical protein n=1 Tax=Hymenobacter rubidus TaxID=1441626 RepID=UPI00191FDE32|nr:hypothetical protein [Hymenobacter rubidus]
MEIKWGFEREKVPARAADAQRKEVLLGTADIFEKNHNVRLSLPKHLFCATNQITFAIEMLQQARPDVLILGFIPARI